VCSSDLDITAELNNLKDLVEKIYWFNKGLQMNYYLDPGIGLHYENRRGNFIIFSAITPGGGNDLLNQIGKEDRLLTFVREDKMDLYLNCIKDDDDILKNYDFNLSKDHANNKINISEKDAILNLNFLEPGKTSDNILVRGRQELEYNQSLTNFGIYHYTFTYNVLDGAMRKLDPVTNIFTEAEIHSSAYLSDDLKRTYLKPIYLMIDKINEYIDVYNYNLNIIKEYIEEGDLWMIYSLIIPINIISFLNINNLRTKINEYIKEKIINLGALKDIFTANLTRIKNLNELFLKFNIRIDFLGCCDTGTGR
jgi:hypothetical protein